MFTNLEDRAAQRDHERAQRTNTDDGARGGYNIRPNIFKPSRLLIFRKCRGYLYTYALLETVASKRASRLDKGRRQQFFYWNRSRLALRALYSPCYTEQPAPRMNLSERTAA